MSVLISMFATSAVVIVSLVYLYREDEEAIKNSIALDLAFFAWFISAIGIVFTSVLNLINLIIGG